MKKLCITIIALVTALSMSVPVFAFNTFPLWSNEQYLIDDKPVTVIVELEDEPVLASQKASVYGAEYMFMPEGQLIEQSILQTQGMVLNEIQDITDTDIEPQYTYTSVFNGFSIEVNQDKIDDIKKLSNVKNVYVTYPLQLYLEHSVEYANSLPTQTIDTIDTNGYTGEGQVIAVIDSEFYTDHEFFSTAPSKPEYDSAEILSKLQNATTTVQPDNFSQVYISPKIPFAYNYTIVKYKNKKGEYDSEIINKVIEEGTQVYVGKNTHGTHVAGIAAGKNANFSGVAPDAQLFLMRIMDNNGSISVPAALAAVNDAVTLGADVINMSIGTDYASPASNFSWDSCLDNAKNAGVAVCASAGNSGMGFSLTNDSNEQVFAPQYATNSDNGAMGTPSGFSSATAVASANGTKYYDNNTSKYKTNTASPNEISYFSSWGVDETLELKPEISAPGFGIYSSIFNNDTSAYAGKSGTSMASPHMAGIYALMYEYFEKRTQAEADAARTQQIENMLMSTATIIRQGNTDAGVPYSPRVQGAGLVNTVAAMKTPAILIGNSGKSKISLGEFNTNTLTVKFNVENITNNPILYDNYSIEVSTNTSNSGIIGTESKALKTTINTENVFPLTVPANSSVELKFNIELDPTELADNFSIFTNGFFIDGFVSLSKSSDTTIPKLSIPFTGFYGNWTDAPALDNTMYDDNISTLYLPGLSDGTIFVTNAGSSLYPCGITNTGYHKNRIAISPNNDGNGDTFGILIRPLRTLKNPKITLKNSSNEPVLSDTEDVFPKYLTTIHRFAPQSLDTLPDGEYTCEFTAAFNYSGAKTESISVPVVVDKTLPEFSNVDLNEDTLTVTAHDNYLINKIDVYIPTPLGINLIGSKYCDSGDTTVSFELPTDADRSKIKIGVMDCALNAITVDLANALGKVLPSITSYPPNLGSISFTLFNSDSNLTGDIILGCYNSAGQLINTSSVYKNKVLPAGQSTALDYTGLGDINYVSYYKLFLWNSISGLTPLDTAKIFSLQ